MRGHAAHRGRVSGVLPVQTDLGPGQFLKIDTAGPVGTFRPPNTCIPASTPNRVITNEKTCWSGERSVTVFAFFTKVESRYLGPTQMCSCFLFESDIESGGDTCRILKVYYEAMYPI